MYPSMSLASLSTALLLSGTVAHTGFDYPHHRRLANGTISRPFGNVRIDVSEFSVKQVRNERYRPKSGLGAMLDVYAKYAAPLTPQLRKALQLNGGAARRHKRQQTGTTSADPPQGFDYEFLCPISIGSPAQQMTVNFDSGSSDLWVFSSDTDSNDVQGQTVYVPGSSSTAVLKAGYNFTISYGDGDSASGEVYNDDMAIGSASVTGMTIEAATEVSAGFTSDQYSWGILGLGMSSGNTVTPVSQLTFMDTIKSSLAAPVFTANLIHGEPGNYDFGFINSSLYTGNIQYEAIDPTSIYWELAVTGYRIGDAPNVTDPSLGYVTYPFRAIADTGTTLLLLPDDLVNAYWADVPGSGYDSNYGGVLFPCTLENSLPDFTFGIGLFKGVVPGRYINYGSIDGTSCYGGIQSQGSLDFSILGDILLKAQFIVFDLGTKRIGFANKALIS